MNKENIIRSANYDLVAKYLWIDPIQVKNFFNMKRSVKMNIENPKDLRVFIEKYELKWQWVYCIENIKNGKKYIWKTNHFYERRRSHFLDLRWKRHKCKPLQSDFNIFWEENFIFSILEIVSDKSILDEVEKRYILRYDISILYNIQFIHLLDFLSDDDLFFVKLCLSRKEDIEKYLTDIL